MYKEFKIQFGTLIKKCFQHFPNYILLNAFKIFSNVLIFLLVN
jgi:hypothetical protein